MGGDYAGHDIIGPMVEWSRTYRVLQLVVLGQVACCATVTFLGISGGLHYQPGANGATDIGSALLFAAILFGALGVALVFTMVSVSRGSGVGRFGVLLAEVLFALFSLLFFAPIAVLFGTVSAIACVLLLLVRRNEL